MPNCYVKHCSSAWTPNEPYKIMHSFPRNKILIKEWLCRLPNQHIDIDRSVDQIFASQQGKHRICSKHFSADSYEFTKGSHRLRKGAVPTIFSHNAPRETLSRILAPDSNRTNGKKKKLTATEAILREHNYATADQAFILNIDTDVDAGELLYEIVEENFRVSIDSPNEITLVSSVFPS